LKRGSTNTSMNRAPGTASRLIFLVFLLGSTQPAYAYVDPGAASVVVAAVLGSIAAVGYSVRMFWGRVKSFFRKRKKDAADTRPQ